MPQYVYLDTSLLTAAVFPGSTDHRSAMEYCLRIADQRTTVYFSQLLRFEFLQSARVIATTPTALFGATRRTFRLARWGDELAVRQRWMTEGAARFEKYLEQFARVVEVPLDRAIWLRSITIMAECHLKSYDATHVATAMRLGIADFASVDADFVRVDTLNVSLIRDAPIR
jgi:predicted nucleic acid-binding protein